MSGSKSANLHLKRRTFPCENSRLTFVSFKSAKSLSIIHRLSLPTSIQRCFPSLPLLLQLSHFPFHMPPCSYTPNRIYVSRMISFSLFKPTARLPSNSAELSWKCLTSLPNALQQRSEGPCLSIPVFLCLERS